MAAGGQVPYKDVHSRASPREKQKMATLCHELLAESLYRIHQTDPIRDEMSTTLGFQIGTIMGTIREKYRMMLEIFSQTMNKYTGKSKLIMPNKSERKPIHFLWRMEMINWLEIEIDRLVHILEQIPIDMLEDYHESIEEKEKLNEMDTEKLNKMGLRAGGITQDFEAQIVQKEEEVKRSYRQEFLMEKVGLSANASEGFLRRLPVEDLLNLDKLN